MADNKPTVEDVVADANATRERLARLERALQEDIDEIDFKAFKEKRPLTPAEVTRRKEFRATQAEVGEDFKVLAFVTARRLDDTAEVGQLLRQMQVINAGLQDDLARLKKIEKYAAIAAEVAEFLDKTATKLVSIAAKVA